MGALPTAKTPILDITHLVGIPAPEHLGHQVIIVAAIVARIDVCKAVPVVGKDLFEDAPSRRSGCSHQAASLRSLGLGIVALLYHVSLTTSTPASARNRDPPPSISPLCHGDVRAIAKWEFLCDAHRVFSCEECGIPAQMQGRGHQWEEEVGKECQRWVVITASAWG